MNRYKRYSVRYRSELGDRFYHFIARSAYEAHVKCINYLRASGYSGGSVKVLGAVNE